MGRLCGGPGVFGPRLEAMQEGGGAFRVRGCGKDRPLVIAQNGQPILNVGSVIPSCAQRNR